MHEIFAALLCQPPPSPRRIARVLSDVLRRNEEARIYRWHASDAGFPPPRHRIDSS